MTQIFRPALLLGAVPITLVGCEAIQNIAPTITNISAPADVSTTASTAAVPFTATVDRKGWGYANIYLTVAPSVDTLFDNAVARVTDATCTPFSSGSSVLDCQVTAGVPEGTWFYQWHIDYGATGADTATLSRPSNPSDTFTVTRIEQVVVTPPPVTTPDETAALKLHSPENGAQCTGSYSVAGAVGGTTTTPLAWGTDTSQPGTNIGGRYQFMVEHPTGSNCTDMAALGLDISAVNAAWAYQVEQGCQFSFANTNGSATEPLRPNRDYRWRVRRILDDDSFGDWTGYSTFRTAGPPTETPVPVEPANGTVNLPSTVVSSTVDLIWRAAGCEPTLFSAILFQDGDTVPNQTIEGLCGWNGDPYLCRASAALANGSSYRVEFAQSNSYGTVQGTYNISVE